ncbi:MAG: hypothetical protein IKK08_11090 [Clostridia bacterium]|nr:hypothetical protein [Clostridia bacterium]
MAIPVMQQEVEQAIRPLLGATLMDSCPLTEDLTAFLRAYAPYRQGLEEFRDELEALLEDRLKRYTHGSMLVVTDRFRTIHLGKEQLRRLTDEVMGVLFDKLTPFSANFLKLNDYSLRVQSLSALRVLVTRYSSYYTEEQLHFIARMIRGIYPPERYQGWLPPEL